MGQQLPQPAFFAQKDQLGPVLCVLDTTDFSPPLSDPTILEENSLKNGTSGFADKTQQPHDRTQWGFYGDLLFPQFKPYEIATLVSLKKKNQNQQFYMVDSNNSSLLLSYFAMILGISRHFFFLQPF